MVSFVVDVAFKRLGVAFKLSVNLLGNFTLTWTHDLQGHCISTTFEINLR